VGKEKKIVLIKRVKVLGNASGCLSLKVIPSGPEKLELIEWKILCGILFKKFSFFMKQHFFNLLFIPSLTVPA